MAEVARGLTEAGLCDKVVEVERSGECRLLVCRRGGSAVVVAVVGYGGWVYAKVVPEEGLPGHMWHCDQVFYTPYGVYAFARSPGELVEKVRAKMRLVEAVSRLAAERAAATGAG